MPRYVFDTSDGETFICDEIGIDLPGLDAMRAEAIAVLPDMARATIPQEDTRTYVSKVRDESGRVVGRLCRQGHARRR